MAAVELTDLKKSFGNVHVIKGVDLDIQQGEFVVFVGPSGCGKSTLLRLIAGLEDISSGTLKIAGDVVNEVPPSKRGIAMVFQSYALYPHMSVYNNMAFGMKLARASKEEIDQRVKAAADMLQLTQLLDRLPRQLSGGQRQRVAIGRAIVRDPQVFLFDEPLSNLDAALRVATRIEIAKLSERMADTTMIYVTHDQVEAMTLADRIVVLNGGIIEQVGSPMELYLHPDNLFVAQFIGSPAMNVVPCTIETGGDAATVRPEGGDIVHTHVGVPESSAGTKGMLGVRPENLRLADGGETIFSGPVDIVEKLGEVTLLYVNTGKPDEPVLAKLEGIANIKRGDTVRLTASPGDLHVFDDKGVAFRRRPTTH
ncbi:ABC transporter ATP-binding protein [Bauldia sp.]|uniref:ABC transporter ATP-binding protein n=1 Tax=Bauldia sp. TaxID=2575872 RepID=UPI003BAD5D65